ncbi:WYL domain-containing protein [Polaribacter sp. Z014]|uniref:helix-turn-helix transcriptional regulator n=1 Tax=Polaribacter sp. Z014 TaxID=2927126 RepID=UPI002020115D|nr:WYL domain-containing protein [Polaribacter sp. Z014]MCL7762212.1 WYL domain-containing protein [Polaribacter sp. Z014]
MSPEFLRRYYILKIITNPKAFGVDNDFYVTHKELQQKLQDKQSEFIENEFLSKLNSNSSKTVHRDLDFIKNEFGVHISLKRGYGYFVKSGNVSEEITDIFNRCEHLLISKKASENHSCVATEKSSLNSKLDLLGLINAIENKYVIHISYKGWYDDNCFEEISKKAFQPLHLKEKDKAWYLLAYCPVDDKITSFCLDERLQEIRIFKRKMLEAIPFDHNAYFKDAIGILNDETKAEKIILQVANHHLKYLISKPIHASQRLIVEPVKWNSEALDYADPDIWGTIELELKPNYEFIMEMLKFNQWIKIISPKSVVDNFKEHLQSIVNYYN